MLFDLDDRLSKLIAAPKYWFADTTNPAGYIRELVAPELRGVYCLWWKNPTTLPRTPRVELNAGKRGKLCVELALHCHGLCEEAAMYVGKGAIRTRLVSHIRPSKNSGRNPHWWMTQIVKQIDGYESISRHLGFSFIEERSGFERIYAENVSIGVLRPWFNLRFTA